MARPKGSKNVKSYPKQTKKCPTCYAKFVGSSVNIYCSQLCFPSVKCGNANCVKLPQERVTSRKAKFCSTECRQFCSKENKPTFSFQCVNCGQESMGTVRKKRCFRCSWKQCVYPSCTNKVYWQKTGCKTHKKMRSSFEEMSLIPKLSAMGYSHTGSMPIWIKWKDGTRKNPDFLDESNKKVFEYFGDHWHKNDRGRESDIIAKWAEVGYKCTILWTENLQEFLEESCHLL